MGSLRKPLFSQQARRGLRIVTLAVCVAAVVCALSGCAQKAEKVEADSAAEATVVEQERAGFIAHGANYGKSETVAVTTDLSGDVRDVAVTEWIKNPEGLETISDATSLNALIVEGEGVRYQQNEDGIVWTTGGQDVRYAGVTNQELPFAISYEYKLDGEVVDPSTLQNVQGQLEINIRYENKTSSTVTAGGASYDVQMPYVMASIVAFDPEHARAAIQAASQSTDAAQAALASLPDPENPTSQSIAALNAGLAKLTESLGQLQAGMGQMSQATQAMGQGVADMLSQAQGALNSKLDLVEALGDYVEAQGAFCGSVDGMPASTMFIVTAQAE